MKVLELTSLSKSKNRKNIISVMKMTLYALFICSFSCGEEDKGCGYTAVATTPIIPVGCVLKSDLNMSTGVGADGVLISPGLGVTDTYWKVLNNPPLLFCDGNPVVTSINGSAYAVNYGNFGVGVWVNQEGATTLAPMDLGTNGSFGCNNATNSEGKIIPYVFERSFCVLKDTHVDFSFNFKGDDQIYMELINNSTNTTVSTSSLFIYNALPLNWSETGLELNAGSYSIRAYLANINSVVLGFSMVGNLVTTDGDLAISNNTNGCCENNTISILNIIDLNCNAIFDSTDQLGKDWIVKVRDSSNTVIRTATTDANGNIFFSGISNGTYTVQITTQNGFTTATNSYTVTVVDNTVKIVEFFNCSI